MIISENDYEINIINKLKSKGFEYFSQEDIIKLRGSLEEVIIEDWLIIALKKINPEATNDHISKIILKIKNLKQGNMINGNSIFHSYITSGVKIYDEKKERTITYKLFDEINNHLVVTNQYKITTLNPLYKNQLPDIVIYINGIPVIVFELKTIKQEENLEMAWRQMSNYQEYLPHLFVYNFFNVIANVSEMKYGSLTSSFQRYQYWRGFDFKGGTENLINDLFSPGKILDLIRNFSFFTSEENTKKIISGYHQFYGVKTSIDSSFKEIKNKDKLGNGKAGIFWHTQGSGKSYSMLFLVRNLSKEIPGTTFIVVTDRNDLDNQLFQTFKKAEEFIGQKIYQIESVIDLKNQLKGRKQDGVYFTTVQKFNEDVKELSDRNNILVITDEAHRSHNNINGTWVFDKKNEQLVEKHGNAKFLRDAFPRSTFIGFTGTPINNDDKSTTKIFGSVITRYLMSDAERDNVVVKIRYESRKPELGLNEKQLDILNKEHREVVDEINNKSNIPLEARKKIKKSLFGIKNFIEDSQRIEGIAVDFIEHYKIRSGILKGKAMFVAFDRHIAFKYYKKIIELAPELEKNLKLIITNVNGQNDPPELHKLAGTKDYRKKMAAEFKKDNSDFKIAIVVDMWLTGFDVPSLDVIYLDKPIKMHNLMQTIARTNRVYTNKKESLNKEYGLIVDYIGLWKKLNEALSFYSGKNEFDINTTRNLEELKPKYIDELQEILSYFKIENLMKPNILLNENQERIRILSIISSEIIKQKEQQLFISKTKKVSIHLKEIISLLSDDERILFQMIMVIRSNLINIELGKLDLTSKTASLKESLKLVIEFKKTTIINEIKGDAIFISDIMNFINNNMEDETKDLETAMKVAATRRLLMDSRNINIRKSEDLTRKLNEILGKYDGNYISLDDLFKWIKHIAAEAFKMHSDVLNDLGYSQEEMAFYKIIKEPTNMGNFDKDKIKIIMESLLKIVNNDKKVNSSWIYNQQSISKVRRELKIILLNNGYPPKDSVTTTEDIIEQIIYQKNL